MTYLFSGNTIISNEVEVKNDTGNALPISKNTTTNSEVNPIFVKGTSDSSFFSPVQSDAFGRLRVSNPVTMFDSQFRYGDNLSKWSQVDVGAGISTHLPNESAMLMSVTGNNDEAIRQTKNVFSYQPGKSLLILNTFVMNNPIANLRQRVGYFSNQNGVIFQVDGTTKSFIIRKYVTGSVDDTSEKQNQATWNGDKLDGTGPSGKTLYVDRPQIFWCDIEWLGVGSVRCGFVIDGQFIVCHTFHHANVEGFTGVYMSTASLPIRYEIKSTGAAGSMKSICSTVMSEGGYINRSRTRTAQTNLTGKNLNTDTYTPLVCIRLKSTRLEGIVIPYKFDLYGLQQAAFQYAIIINPTLTNADWVSAGSDSDVEYDISATALTGGTTIDAGIFVGATKGGSASVTTSEVDFTQQLGKTINGVSDIYCIAARATTNNDDAVAVLTWQEHV